MKLNFKLSKRQLTFAHIILLLLFITLLPQSCFTGYERSAVTFVTILLIFYALLLRWDSSIVLAVFFTLLLTGLDGRKAAVKVETFESKDDIKPAGKGTGDADIKPGNTHDEDNTGLTDDDLDNILKVDKETEDKVDEKQKEAFNEAGGGLDGLSVLLKKAREDSPYPDNKTPDDYTPAQAQRETHRLIDTVEQLKVTMKEMMPLMKSGNNLMQLYQKMGGKELTKAFN